MAFGSMEECLAGPKRHGHLVRITGEAGFYRELRSKVGKFECTGSNGTVKINMGVRKRGRQRKMKPVVDPGRALELKEKADRAAELEIASRELAYQNAEKEKRAQELFLANIELSYQNEQKEKRAAELAEAIKDLEAFAYVSSHHLQEPLRKIRSFVDRILDREARNLSEKGRHDLERIEVASARISRLIQDIYTYSRINVDDPVFVRLNPQSIVTEAVGNLAEIIEEKKAIIEMDIPVEINLIPSQFRQVIHQLLDNSLKYSKPQIPPRITVSGKMVSGEAVGNKLQSVSEPYACIEVSDNGLGFDPKYNETIFRIFERLHAVEDYPGTGIGLAIVKKIMSRHGGFVWATGAPGVGAALRLYFPLRVH